MKFSFVTSLAFALMASAAGASPTAPQKIKLVEFAFDAMDTPVKMVSCSEYEVNLAVWNHVDDAEALRVQEEIARGMLVSKIKDPSEREFRPSYDPLKGEAAWYIFNDRCKGMTEQLNGIGFHSYDHETGDAVMYLSMFDTKYLSSDQWAKADPQERVRSIFQPKFVIRNLFVFPAKCSLVYKGLKAKIGLQKPDLVCNTENGFIRFITF